MRRVFEALGVGALVYIVANQVLGHLITGTSTGDAIFTNLVPIAIVVGIVVLLLRSLGRGTGGGR